MLTKEHKRKISIANSKPKISKQCLVCERNFWVNPARGLKARFCSRICFGVSQKGHTPWNKGKKGIYSEKVREIMGKDKVGKIPWNKGKTGIYSKESLEKNRVAHLGSKSSLWKGGVSAKDGYFPFMYRRRKIKKLSNGGSHTLVEWETLLAQYNWTCPSCKKQESEIKLTEDHIIPVTKGGSDNIENIQPLCGSCNSKKKTKIIKYDYELIEVKR